MALALQPQHRINVRSGCAKKLSHVRRSASRPQRAGKTEAHGRRAALSIAGTLALAPPEAGAVKLPVQRQERKYSVRIPYEYFNEIDSTGLCVYDFKLGTGTKPEKGSRVASHYDLKTSGQLITVGTSRQGSGVTGGVPYGFDLWTPAAKAGGPFLPAFNYAILPRDEEKQEYTMRAGGLRRVLVPPTLGYGPTAVDVIPANS